MANSPELPEGLQLKTGRCRMESPEYVLALLGGPEQNSPLAFGKRPGGSKTGVLAQLLRITRLSANGLARAILSYIRFPARAGAFGFLWGHRWESTPAVDQGIGTIRYQLPPAVGAKPTEKERAIMTV